MSQSLSSLLVDGATPPQSDRANRLLVAQRLAEAVAAVHADGRVVGHLDDHHVQVAPDGTVTLDDAAGATTSSPAYTAPERQGSFSGAPRPEVQHDHFALAVLLFRLLMEGHHPYAGTWVGGGALPEVPKAIQLGLYAYGGSSAVRPPPGAPELTMLEPGLSELFARSFGATSATFRTRPTGAEWATALAAAQRPGQAESAAPAPAAPAPALAPPGALAPGALGLPTAAAAETLPGVPDRAHPPIPEIQLPVTGQGAPREPAAPPAVTRARPSLPPDEASPMAVSQAAPEAAPATTPAHAIPPDQVRRWPEPSSSLAGAPPAQPGPPVAPARRTFSRRAMLARVVPPADVPLAGAQPQPAEPSFWENTASEIRWLAESELPWLTEVLSRKQVSRAIAGGLLFLIVLGLARRGNEMPDPGARPVVVQATRPPVTQTPPPRPAATRIATRTPTVASFGDNFDVADQVIPSSGEGFVAQIRDKILRLDAYDKGTRGRVMFDAAPATGDFHFTVRLGAITGQGELLIYVRNPDTGQTWVFAIDPARSTWGLSEISSRSNELTPLLAPMDYRVALARSPLRTISVVRTGGKMSLLINGATVSSRATGRMPRISGPVLVGIGTMIPEDPRDFERRSFVVTVERVAMLADEA